MILGRSLGSKVDPSNIFRLASNNCFADFMKNFSDQFDGKIAIVTGGTQGLGLATALLLAARGAAGLVICGRNAKKGEAAAASLTRIGVQRLL
jgi:short subunit dehydrogenase